MNQARLSVILIVTACALALAACGGGGSKKTPTPSATAPGTTVAATATTAATAAATGTPAATEEPFSGSRQKVEVAGPTAPPTIILSDVRAGAHTDYDRVSFQFDGSVLPGYRVQYVTKDQVVGCGSGEAVPVSGTAFLEVHFTPVDAHDAQGQTTVSSTDLKPGLTTLQEAALTCDFEAVGNWVLGLSQEVDFRVITLDNPPRIAVDVGHP